MINKVVPVLNVNKKLLCKQFKSLISPVGHLELFDFVLFLGNR